VAECRRSPEVVITSNLSNCTIGRSAGFSPFKIAQLIKPVASANFAPVGLAEERKNYAHIGEVWFVIDELATAASAIFVESVCKNLMIKQNCMQRFYCYREIINEDPQSFRAPHQKSRTSRHSVVYSITSAARS
jgi:hypothetical protein